MFPTTVAQVTVLQVTLPDPALILLLFVVIAPELMVPVDPIFRFPEVTFPAAIDVATIFPVIRDAAMFPTTVAQVTVLQVTLPDPALMLLLFVLIAPELMVPVDPIFKFPAVTFPAAIEDAAMLPVI